MFNFIKSEYKLNLKKDILVSNFNKEMSSGIQICMLNSTYLKNLHKKDFYFKFYNFSMFKESPINGIYKKGNTYTVEFNFLDKKMSKEFEIAFFTRNNPVFYIEDKTKEENIHMSDINYLISNQPTVITYNNKNIDCKNIELDLVKQKLSNNAIHKYNKLMNSDLNYYEFIDSIQLLENNSKVCNYKNGIIIGNKYVIKIKKDDISQILAFILLFSGLGEKNALGFGFCKKK